MNFIIETMQLRFWLMAGFVAFLIVAFIVKELVEKYQCKRDIRKARENGGK